MYLQVGFAMTLAFRRLILDFHSCNKLLKTFAPRSSTFFSYINTFINYVFIMKILKERRSVFTLRDGVPDVVAAQGDRPLWGRASSML